MSQIQIPTLLFWENGNTWYGSKGNLRFYIQPGKNEAKEPTLDVELWMGPLTKALSEIFETASFPLSDEGIAALTEWLEKKAAQINSPAVPQEKTDRANETT